MRRLGLGSALGLLVLGRVLLDASVLLFVGIAIAARGVDYGTAVRIVATDPLPLGAAQLAALGAVTSLGVWLWTPAEQPAPALGLVATRRRFALVAALAGVALQLPMVELTTLIARLWPALVHTPEQDAMIETLTRVSSPLRAITVPFTFVVIAPVTEELLFRGLLLRSLRTRYGRAVAIGVTAVLFAVFHLDPQALVFATLIGIVLGVIADRARSIVPSIALHAGFNALPLLAPRELVAIPGFNTGETGDVPWPLVLGSSALALAMLALLARMMRRAEDEPDPSA